MGLTNYEKKNISCLFSLKNSKIFLDQNPLLGGVGVGEIVDDCPTPGLIKVGNLKIMRTAAHGSVASDPPLTPPRRGTCKLAL